jgi:hypothetical protein
LLTFFKVAEYVLLVNNYGWVEMAQIPEDVIDWLLEEGNPSIRYRTMLELLDLPNTRNEVKEAKDAVMEYPVVQHILKKMHPEGYWEVKKRGGRIIGTGVEYADWSTTHFVLSYLVELGLTKIRISRGSPGLKDD